jgi:ABC-2 type transport system permease protein
MIERGAASALLRIPEGFSDDLLEGRPVALELVRNPAQSILPEIAEQTMTVLADALDSGSRVLREPLDRLAPLLRDPDYDPGATGVSQLSVAFYDAVDRASPWVMPPVVTLSVVQLGAEGDGDGGDTSGGSSSSSTFSVFLFVFPGISVWALFMIADHAMRDILTEFTAGTLRRQLCGPLPPWMLVAGKTLYTAVVALLAWVVLGAVAAFTLQGAVDILGVALMSVAVLLASTGFGAVVYGVSRTAGRGATLSSIVLLATAFMGGAFIPLGSLPGALRAVAPVSPFYWSTTAFQALLSSAAGWREILPNAGILAGLGCGLLATGSLLLGRTVRGGAA